MKLKTLTGIIAVACILGSAAFGQMPQPPPQGMVRIAGTVTTDTTDSQIFLKCGTDTWVISRKPTTTTVVNSDGSQTQASQAALTSGLAVIIQCNSPDSQKKERPALPTPTPTP